MLFLRGFSRKFELEAQLGIFELGKKALKIMTTAATKVANPNPDRIEAHVWALMQTAGEHAVNRMTELLSTSKFNRLSASDQISLIKLAMDRAHGKVDAPTRKVVTLNANLNGVDLASLVAKSNLPEYSLLKDVTPPKPAPSATSSQICDLRPPNSPIDPLDSKKTTPRRISPFV